MQVLALVDDDVLVQGAPGVGEQSRGLAGDLQVGGLACRPQVSGHSLGDLPDAAALGLAERVATPGSLADEVVLLGAQVLAEDDLLPFVHEETGGETANPGVGCRRREAFSHGGSLGDPGAAVRLAVDAVGQLVDVDDLDTVSDALVSDQEGELGLEGVSQAVCECG